MNAVYRPVTCVDRPKQSREARFPDGNPRHRQVQKKTIMTKFRIRTLRIFEKEFF